MNKTLTPRYIIITIILAWAVYALWPTIRYQNLSIDEKETMREAGTLDDLESQIIKQGLDLKGGMYIVLEADIPTLLTNLAINKDLNFEKTLSSVKESMGQAGVDIFRVFREEAARRNLRLARYYHEYGSNPNEIISELEEEAEDAVNRVLEIIQNRIDQFGVSEPTIQKQGNHRIIVELAGIQDPKRARSLLQSTALLEFYLAKDPEVTNDVLIRIDNLLKGSEALDTLASTEFAEVEGEESEKGVQDQQVSDDKAMSISELFGESPEVTRVSDSDSAVIVDQRLFEERPFSSLLRNLGTDIGVPENNVYALNRILKSPEVDNLLEVSNGLFLFGNEAEVFTGNDGSQEKLYRLYYLESNPPLTGGVVEEAKASIGSLSGSSSGQPIVSLAMNSEGVKKWARITGANIGRRIAIVLDKKVHMAPSIREKIPSGRTQIEGFANMNEAKDIAIVLRAGALPAPVNIIEERIVGPSLGADSIKKGTISVLIGLGLVLVFMLIYYKLSGIIADFALIWNLLLVLAVLASLDATLTLPGIAGLILTIGMSIDANVIIFERIREELRKGKTPKSAIQSGYERALTTIIDANVTTMIAALVLYQFGTGPIRGFATVLFWGIMISMFTAIFVTRTIFNTYSARKGLQKLSI